MSDQTPWHPRSPWRDALLKVEPEYHGFITLSGPDVLEMTTLAQHAEDPITWLTDELNKRGKRKKDIRDADYARRRKEDAGRISDVAAWPNSHLPLKTQPWITNAEGKMRFALIHCSDLLTVIEQGKAPVTFNSVAEIVETWSVD